MLCRTVTPSLLALLQHPVEDRRAFAAEYAGWLSAASNVVLSALLSSSNGLSTLLMRLSGDDTPQSKSFYARLIACCTSQCDAAALKKISDSGAVPYLLQLLRQADDWTQQYNAVLCLEARLPVPCCARCCLLALCVQMHAISLPGCDARCCVRMAAYMQDKFRSALTGVTFQEVALLGGCFTVLDLLQSRWNNCITCHCITCHCITCHFVTCHCITWVQRG